MNSSTNISPYKEFVLKYQRDINCLSDADRFVRKNSLQKFLQFFQKNLSSSILKDDDAQLSDLNEFFQNQLVPKLLYCISDKVEKCREIAIEILHAIQPYMKPLQQKKLFIDFTEVLNARVGVLPFNESAEEVRAQLISLEIQLINSLPLNNEEAKSELSNSIDLLAQIFSKLITDGFPDTKKFCCSCICILCDKFSSEMKYHVEVILRPLLKNLGHQHSKIRTSALQAIEKLIPCRPDQLPELMKDLILPSLINLVNDRTISVRKQLMLVIQYWFEKIENCSRYHSSLLPILLCGISDESEEIQETSIEIMNHLGDQWNIDLKNQIAMDEISLIFNFSTDPSYEISPLPFQRRPNDGSRAFVRKILPDILPPILAETSNWTVQTRARSAMLLRTAMIYAEDAINPFLEKIFASLAKTCRDTEPIVRHAINECVSVVGKYGNPDTIYGILLPGVLGSASGTDLASHKTNSLVLLHLVIKGMTSEKSIKHLQEIASCICDDGIREIEDVELQEALGNTVSVIINTVNKNLANDDNVGFQLFWVVNQLLAATPSDSYIHNQANESLQSLAKCFSTSEQGIYEKYFSRLISSIKAPSNEKENVWIKGSPKLNLFDWICRHGGRACGKNADLLIPIFIHYLDESKDAVTRLSFLVLLETMLGQNEINQSLRLYGKEIIMKGILPNIVWRAGKVAATIRKVAMACTYTLLRQSLVDQPCLYEVTPHMLPILTSSLDSEDFKTRQLVCLSLQYLFAALPGALGPEPVSQIYHEILKRLDDSNDLVRKAACATYRTFIKASPKENFYGTIFDYSLDCLFIHLDDTDPDIQEEVYLTLREMVSINSTVLEKKAVENRTRHRNPIYCDKLKEFCQA